MLKKTWTAVNTLIGKKRANLPTSLNDHDKRFSNDNKNFCKFNNHFRNVAGELSLTSSYHCYF